MLHNINQNKIDVLFINPRDLSVPQPYVKTTTYAALLLENGIKTKIFEPKASNLSHDFIINFIKEKRVQIICVSAFPSTLPDAYNTIKQIRKLAPNSIIVLEGYHVNADSNAVLELNADYGLIGDAEFSFLELTSCLLKEKEVNQNLDGIIFNKNGKLIVNKRAFIRDLNTLPTPAFDLLPIGKYYSASTNKTYMVIFTDRGCPYSCSFCSSPAQMKYRMLSVDNVIKQLKKLVLELKVEWLEFMDLTFTINKKRTTDICKRIIDENLVFDWACETRADLLDDELLNWMKKAGCKKITIGVESGNEALRFETGKRISNEVFKEVFLMCKKNDIKVMSNYIFGHPNETLKTALQTIYSSIKLESFNVLFTKMTPLPDVALYKSLVSKGKIEADIWYKYMRNEVNFPVYYPDKLGRRKMEFLYRTAFIIFYCRPVSLLKFGKMLTDFKFFKSSIGVWLTFVFGKTIYK